MARPKEHKKTRALATFADVLIVKKDNLDVSVPTSSDANKALNCLLVSQMRHMMHENLKLIRDREAIITPREMKDLIDAMAALTKASSDAYETLESLDDASPKDVTPDKDEAIDTDFTTLTTTKDGPPHDGATPAPPASYEPQNDKADTE
jgi:hypothetical protein